MRSQQRETVRKGARFLAQELVREPVRAAVRDALREEAASVQSASANDTRPSIDDRERRAPTPDDRSSSSRRPALSKLGIAVLGLVAILGVRMFMRRRRGGSDQSAGSEFQRDTGTSGYDTGESGGYSSVGTADADEPGASSTSSTD